MRCAGIQFNFALLFVPQILLSILHPLIKWLCTGSMFFASILWTLLGWTGFCFVLFLFVISLVQHKKPKGKIWLCYPLSWRKEFQCGRCWFFPSFLRIEVPTKESYLHLLLWMDNVLETDARKCLSFLIFLTFLELCNGEEKLFQSRVCRRENSNSGCCTGILAVIVIIYYIPLVPSYVVVLMEIVVHPSKCNLRLCLI